MSLTKNLKLFLNNSHKYPTLPILLYFLLSLTTSSTKTYFLYFFSASVFHHFFCLFCCGLLTQSSKISLFPKFNFFEKNQLLDKKTCRERATKRRRNQRLRRPWPRRGLRRRSCAKRANCRKRRKLSRPKHRNRIKFIFEIDCMKKHFFSFLENFQAIPNPWKKAAPAGAQQIVATGGQEYRDLGLGNSYRRTQVRKSNNFLN